MAYLKKLIEAHTICSSCGRILEEEYIGEKYILCKDCKRFVPVGSKSYLKLMKGGVEMVTKKTKEKEDIKVKVSTVRAEKAAKIKKFILEDLKLPITEIKPVLSNLYTSLSKELSKKK